MPGVSRMFLSERFQRLGFRTDIVLRHPLVGTLVTLLIILAGGLGSIFSHEIRSAFPFAPPGPHWIPEAVGFWAVAATASLLFFGRQSRLDAASAEAHRELIEVIDTMPPSDFMENTADLFGLAERTYQVCLHQPGTRELAIRWFLRFFTILASKFAEGTGRRYAASLMIYHESKSMTTADLARFQRKLTFVEEGVDIRHLRGVLHLNPKYSAIECGDLVPDPLIEEFVLPIPTQSKTNRRYKVLPGAPLAFVDREPDLYDDVGDIRAWAQDHADFTDAVISEMETYFRSESGQKIRSFISIPLIVDDESVTTGESDDPIAVLNIHCDKPHVLHERREAAGRFVSAAWPMTRLLVRVLASAKQEGELDRSDNSMLDSPE